MTDAIYIHGTSSSEQDRLELMNGLLNTRCLAELRLEPGERVLEMGAGTGVFAAELAAAVGPGGEVVAVERDERQLVRARERGAASGFDVRGGSVYEPPLADAEWGTFDLVHARFLLEHLDRPEEACAVMLRAVRPGGRVVLVDDDHSLMRFWPDPGGMVELWADYALQYERLGFDPWIGRRLAALLVGAGAELERTTQIDYGAAAGHPLFASVARNLAEVVGGARATVLEGSDWTGERFDRTLEAFREWTLRPDAAIWYALPCAVARRPVGG